jgi:hypothetical protein
LFRFCTIAVLLLCVVAPAWDRALAAPGDIGNEEASTNISDDNLLQRDDAPAASLDDYSSAPPEDAGPQEPMPTDEFLSKLRWLGLRHSSYSGRNAGMGEPLVGTSWMNRPYYVGADIGPVWITKGAQEDITTDNDTYGGVFAGYECDYYWGTELSVQRATPELKNEDARRAPRGDRRMYWTASVLYYPWGDSLIRPYWRTGLGLVEIDYPLDNGTRRDEGLWQIPIGLGVKYPFRRWLTGRAEFADQIGLGNSGVATQHDLTLTIALEWRLGAKPRSYWPWNPSRHIW